MELKRNIIPEPRRPPPRRVSGPLLRGNLALPQLFKQGRRQQLRLQLPVLHHGLSGGQRKKHQQNFYFYNVSNILQMLLTITLFSSAYLLDLVPRTLLGPYTWKQGISSFSSVFFYTTYVCQTACRARLPPRLPVLRLPLHPEPLRPPRDEPAHVRGAEAVHPARQPRPQRRRSKAASAVKVRVKKILLCSCVF